MLAAGPLLVASVTSDAFLIAMGAAASRMPWLLLSLHVGVLADGLDRRRLLIAANLVRVAALGALIEGIFTGHAGVAWVLITLAVLGAAECVNDVTASTLMPMLVAPRDLGIANARVMFGNMTVNQMIGPPLGAALFAVGASLPVAAQIVLLLAVLGQVRRIRLPQLAPRERRAVRHEVADGFRFLIRNAPVRTLALTIFAFNVTYGSTFAVLVIYASQRLGLGEFGFGILAACVAVGGVIGAAGYGTLERHFSLSLMMRVGLIVETLTHGVLALTTNAVVAGAALILFGVQASVWGTTATAVRQRAVPAHLQGRVTSVYLLGLQTGLIVGAFMGGAVTRTFDVQTTLVLGCAGSALILMLIWRQLPLIAHADQAREGRSGPAGPR